jgi:hypothetical protein
VGYHGISPQTVSCVFPENENTLLSNHNTVDILRVFKIGAKDIFFVCVVLGFKLKASQMQALDT